jgi:uncharacterized protein YecE (DUF72 family)
LIRVGLAGWSYPDWEGVVYPRRKPAGFHALEYVARYFDLVEINSSFYAFPRAENAERWLDLVAPRANFRFTAKLHQDFTHGRRVDSASASTFRRGVEPLVRAGRMSAYLAQFPWSFGFGDDELALVSRLADEFREAPLAVELRHASWFDDGPRRALLDLGVSLAEIDLPRSPTAPPVHVPERGRLGYLRLHGRNASAWFAHDASRDRKYDYLYDDAEIEVFASRAHELDRAHDETFVVTNNHFSGKGATNAIELAAAITRAKQRVPEPLIAHFPRLARIAAPEPGLFG